MRIAITGASGLIGSALEPALHERGHDVVRLVRRAPEGANEIRWDPAGASSTSRRSKASARSCTSPARTSASAGPPSGAGRCSRRGSTGRLVAEAVAALDPRPVLLCASAVGYYGQRGDKMLTEGAPRGEGFLAEASSGVGVGGRSRARRRRPGRPLPAGADPRPSRGMLQADALPFHLGLGGRVGSGTSGGAGSHDRRHRGGVRLRARAPGRGEVFNLASPEPLRNRDFVRTLGGAAPGRPSSRGPGGSVRSSGATWATSSFSEASERCLTACSTRASPLPDARSGTRASAVIVAVPRRRRTRPALGRPRDGAEPRRRSSAVASSGSPRRGSGAAPRRVGCRSRKDEEKHRHRSEGRASRTARQRDERVGDPREPLEEVVRVAR